MNRLLIGWYGGLRAELVRGDNPSWKSRYVKESKQKGGRLCRRPLDDMNEYERSLSHEFLEEGLGNFLWDR